MTIISLIGFSCSDEYEAPCYGIQIAKYIITGKVTSKTTLKTIPNIQVAMLDDTVLTDNDGKYQVETVCVAYTDDFSLNFKDVDGSDNENFQDTDTAASFTDHEFSGGDGNWYLGEVSKEINIELNPNK